MGQVTGIEWCDHTYNPWIGCTKVSPACDHCYADAQEGAQYGRVAIGAAHVGSPAMRHGALHAIGTDKRRRWVVPPALHQTGVDN